MLFLMRYCNLYAINFVYIYNILVSLIPNKPTTNLVPKWTKKIINYHIYNTITKHYYQIPSIYLRLYKIDLVYVGCKLI